MAELVVILCGKLCILVLKYISFIDTDRYSFFYSTCTMFTTIFCRTFGSNCL